MADGIKSWNPVWEEVFSSQAWGKYPGEDLIRFVARNFYSAPDRKKIKILEVGCGPGANLWFAAREGFTVYGIEGSKTAVAKAISRLDQEVPGWQGSIQVGDICDLPFQDGVVDAVIDIEAIYCNSFESSRRIFSEIHRVLKPGGLFYSRTFATGCVGDRTGTPAGHHAWQVTEGPLAHKGLVRFTDYEDICSLLGDQFEVLQCELLTRTIGGAESGKSLKEWLLEARKK